MSACVLLLPPIAIGVAAYAMLPSRDEVTAQPSTMPVADVGNATSALAVATAPAQPPVDQPSPQGQSPAPFSTGAGTGPRKDPARIGERSSAPPRSAAPTPLPPAPPAPTSAAAVVAAAGIPDTPTVASASEQSAEKDLARVMGPVPVHVTVLVAPNAGHAAERPEGTETGVPPSAAVLEESAPNSSPRMAGDPPAGGRAGHAGRHLRKHFARHVTHRSAARDESHAEAKPRSFSLRNWLQQLGSRQRPPQQRG